MDEPREFGDVEPPAEYYSGKAKPCAYCGREFNPGELVMVDEINGLLFCVPGGRYKIGKNVTDCLPLWVFKNARTACGNIAEYFGKE